MKPSEDLSDKKRQSGKQENRPRGDLGPAATKAKPIYWLHLNALCFYFAETGIEPQHGKSCQQRSFNLTCHQPVWLLADFLHPVSHFRPSSDSALADRVSRLAESRSRNVRAHICSIHGYTL